MLTSNTHQQLLLPSYWVINRTCHPFRWFRLEYIFFFKVQNCFFSMPISGAAGGKEAEASKLSRITEHLHCAKGTLHTHFTDNTCNRFLLKHVACLNTLYCTLDVGIFYLKCSGFASVSFSSPTKKAQIGCLFVMVALKLWVETPRCGGRDVLMSMHLTEEGETNLNGLWMNGEPGLPSIKALAVGSQIIG